MFIRKQDLILNLVENLWMVMYLEIKLIFRFPDNPFAVIFDFSLVFRKTLIEIALYTNTEYRRPIMEWEGGGGCQYTCTGI